MTSSQFTNISLALAGQSFTENVAAAAVIGFHATLAARPIPDWLGLGIWNDMVWRVMVSLSEAE